MAHLIYCRRGNLVFRPTFSAAFTLRLLLVVSLLLLLCCCSLAFPHPNKVLPNENSKQINETFPMPTAKAKATIKCVHRKWLFIVNIYIYITFIYGHKMQQQQAIKHTSNKLRTIAFAWKYPTHIWIEKSPIAIAVFVFVNIHFLLFLYISSFVSMATLRCDCKNFYGALVVPCILVDSGS